MPDAQDNQGPPGCSEPDSAINRVFELLGKRWTGLVVAALMSGPGHFGELRRAVPGISERMLSDRLSELAALGLLTRHVVDGPPVRVKYELTRSGYELRPALVELSRWAEENLDLGGARCPEQLRP
ncbi:winged helix-turn-helix transcriptional regulator [Streptomyces avicenniae]|uniref:winged helix-turn-helix transcriptional regulator n=1 Tax=Streptomyces avicenniae TaxID=500153 RepID=UPI00069B9B4F|nr:helix-turn-helix domain-containing protein [Streptomyces avicenniae]